jgi:hypothetical protein
VRDKLHCREENNPDRRLRPPNRSSQRKDVTLLRQPGCWLRSSHSFKECVIAHWSSDIASIIDGTKLRAEDAGSAYAER